MAEHVQITVRSTSRFGGQEDQLIFRGTGTLEKLPEGGNKTDASKMW